MIRSLNLFFTLVLALLVVVAPTFGFQQSTGRSWGSVHHHHHGAVSTAKPLSARAGCAVGHEDSNVVVTMMAVSGNTLVKEPVRTGGPAVLERPETKRTEEPTKQRRRVGGEAWEVRIYNDGMNTREHVARSLVQVTGMSEISAYQTMMQAHQNGIAVVGRWCYEVAEMYHDALRKNGIICDIVPVDEDL